ncbi:MAG TPA: ABC transporter ATP-binding protein [Candidatus Angelobacter sp.]|jgi:ABC-2 type transport system ATP-binding protein
MSTAISVRNLRKEFGTGSARTVAVDEVTFALHHGEILGFLGPNGAGKTTTIKMLCGLIKPTRGSIRIGEEDVAVRPRQAMLHLGTVLEGSRNTYWRLTVTENLEYFASCRGAYTRDFSRTIDRLLTTLGLTSKRHALVQTLSRGMQQKVALACALCTNPQILLLDEPTLGLDLHSSIAIQKEIRRLAHEEGKAILLTTHQMEIASLSTHIAVMDRGRIVALDAVKSLLGSFSVDVYQIRLQGTVPLGCRIRLERQWDAKIFEDGLGTTLHIPCGRVQNLSSIVEVLEHCSATIVSLHRVEPSLDQVYLGLLEGSRETLSAST